MLGVFPLDAMKCKKDSISEFIDTSEFEIIWFFFWLIYSSMSTFFHYFF